jgi:hypothetical protein
MGPTMRADILERLSAIARGEIVPVPGGTHGTPGTMRPSMPAEPRTRGDIPDRRLGNGALGRIGLGTSKRQKSPVFQTFQVFQGEHDAFAEAERAPPTYADAWATFQTRKPGFLSPVAWRRAMVDAGRFLDEWADLALDFGWLSDDIFGRVGLARFCAGELVRGLGPDKAITGGFSRGRALRLGL